VKEDDLDRLAEFDRSIAADLLSSTRPSASWGPQWAPPGLREAIAATGVVLSDLNEKSASARMSFAASSHSLRRVPNATHH